MENGCVNIQTTWNFHRLSVDIILMIRVCRCFRRCLKGFSGFQLIEKDCRGEIEEDKKSHNTTFDSHEFGVSKEHFPFKAIQITKKPPEWRTETDVKHLQNRMLLLESYRQYSPTLQRLLARVVRYERFGRRRVIIKKGQFGDSFYFIYFGTVAVTNDDDGSSAFVDTAPTLIRKGASFGEVALLNGTRRIATVVCVEDTELLVVDKRDFFAYKLDMELQRESRNRYECLRAMELFETMPNSSIGQLTNFCKVERFNYGQMVSSDITETSSITFITKGVCEILRLVDLTTCPSYQKWLTKKLHLPKSKLPMKEKGQAAADIACVDRFKSTLWNSFSGQKLNELKELYTYQPLSKLHAGDERQSSLFNKSQKRMTLKVDSGSKSLFSEEQDKEKEVVQKVILGPLGNKLTCRPSYGEMPASVAAAVYIRVDELHKGEYLTNMQDDRPMIMVSQGTEVIRLKKEKLEEFADEATMIKLLSMKVKYPSDDELCQVFLRYNAWEMFKKDLLSLVLQPKLMKMVHLPAPYPSEEIYESWYVNKAGILDLTKTPYQKDLPSKQCTYMPAQLGQTKDSLPLIGPRLIHGIDTLRPSLNEAFS